MNQEHVSMEKWDCLVCPCLSCCNFTSATLYINIRFKSSDLDSNYSRTEWTDETVTVNQPYTTLIFTCFNCFFYPHLRLD